MYLLTKGWSCHFCGAPMISGHGSIEIKHLCDSLILPGSTGFQDQVVVVEML